MKGVHAALSRLTECAERQKGYLTIRQVRHVGVQDHQIGKLVESDDIERVRAGIYRLTSLPVSPNGPLVVAVLWPSVRTPDFRGVISHGSALVLHGIEPAGDSPIHITLPTEGSVRRTVPADLRIHYGVLPAADIATIDGIPVTTPLRAIRDVCATQRDASWRRALLTRAVAAGCLPPGANDRLIAEYRLG